MQLTTLFPIVCYIRFSFFILCVFLSFNAISQEQSQNKIAALDVLKETENLQNPNAVLEKLNEITGVENLDDSLRAAYYFQKGVAFGQLGVSDSSFQNLSSARHFALQIESNYIIMRSYNAAGLVYRSLGRYEESLAAFQKALAIAEGRKKEFVQAEGEILGNAGGIFYQLQDLQSAKDYTQRSLDISIEIADTSGLAYNNLRLAIVYQSMDSLDRSLHHLNVAGGFLEILQDTVTLLFKEDTQGSIYKKLGKMDAALKHYKQAVFFGKALGHMEPLIHTMHMVAEIKLEQGKVSEAEDDGREVLELAKKIHHGRHMKSAHELLYEIALKRNDYEQALYHSDIFHALSDSLNNVEAKERVAELQTKYETTKKEQQIADLEKKNQINELEAQQEKQWRYFLILTAVGLLVVIVLVYNRYRLKNRAEKLLAEKNEQLSELNRTKNRLFSIIAHDLKSPLSAFSMLVGALKENSGNLSREELDEYLNTILNSSEDINKLLVNLLDWARIQSNNMVFDPQQNSIVETVQKAYEPLKLNAKLKGIKFTNNSSGEGYFDDIMIVTILRNLISNSIKFTPEGGEITIKSEEDDDYSVISVTDTGMGISPEVQKNLFENKRLSSSSQNGTGLGLIISKDLVEKHQGVIKVQSEEGKGTTFNIYLPKNTKEMMVA